MKTISIGNEKGGVGKTTMALHIAAGLAIRGERVLLIDADAQGTLTQGLGLEKAPGFYDIFVRNQDWESSVQVVPPEVYEQPNEPARGLLAILPGNEETESVSRRITELNHIYLRIQEMSDVVDTVIFDTSPTPSLLHGVIYYASDAILYPTQCDPYSVNSVMNAIQRREEQMIPNAKNKKIYTLGVIPTQKRNTVVHDMNEEKLKDAFGEKVWPAIANRSAWVEAAELRQTIFAYDPNHDAAKQMWDVITRVQNELAYV